MDDGEVSFMSHPSTPRSGRKKRTLVATLAARKKVNSDGSDTTSVHEQSGSHPKNGENGRSFQFETEKYYKNNNHTKLKNSQSRENIDSDFEIDDGSDDSEIEAPKTRTKQNPGTSRKLPKQRSVSSENDDISELPLIYGKHKISSSDIDLRKSAQPMIQPHNYSQPKRTVSLTQAEILHEKHGYNGLSISNNNNLYEAGPSGMGRATFGLDSNDFPNGMAWSTMGPPQFPTDMMSERSYATTSYLRPLSTLEAKRRGFLMGSANTGGHSLLGAEELERCFPDRKIRIFVGTWNMFDLKIFNQNLSEFIHPEDIEHICDMYVIGTQESTSNRTEWEISVQEILGPQFVLMHTAVFGVLYLVIFIRRDLVWYCSVVEEAHVSTRTSVVTKGGVGVCFILFGTSFLLINSHFSAYDGRVKDRIEDFNKICTGLEIPRVLKIGRAYSQDTDVTSKFDCVLWFGDMNFRIVKERERVDHKVRGIAEQDIPVYEDLLEHDELSQARNEGKAFQNFTEGRIKFKPTYKYDPNTDIYDTSKKLRIPSYTDRILFRARKKGTVICTHYNCADAVKCSDHRPVYGVYEVSLRPGRDTIPLGAGQFNKHVWLSAIKRRAFHLDVLKPAPTDPNSRVCTVQ